MYAGRTRNGFTPASREKLFERLKPLEVAECPFVNLPEKKSGRWGAGLTATKMKDCRWLQPVLVGQFEFVEWTPENHLRHTSFDSLREETCGGGAAGVTEIFRYCISVDRKWSGATMLGYLGDAGLRFRLSSSLA